VEAHTHTFPFIGLIILPQIAPVSHFAPVTAVRIMQRCPSGQQIQCSTLEAQFHSLLTAARATCSTWPGSDNVSCGSYTVIALNPFQSNFSANRILPSCYLFWAAKRLVDYCNYPTVLKEKNIEKQKEYNLRYLLAKVRTT
jgi:hypothetical protein